MSLTSDFFYVWEYMGLGVFPASGIQHLKESPDLYLSIEEAVADWYVWTKDEDEADEY